MHELNFGDVFGHAKFTVALDFAIGGIGNAIPVVFERVFVEILGPPPLLIWRGH